MPFPMHTTSVHRSNLQGKFFKTAILNPRACMDWSIVQRGVPGVLPSMATFQDMVRGDQNAGFDLAAACYERDTRQSLPRASSLAA
jgi:hypothetical protein